jgi:hypothetical protein
MVEDDADCDDIITRSPISFPFLNCGMCAGLQSIVSDDAVQDSLSTDDAYDDGGAARASNSTAVLTTYLILVG